MLKLSMVFQKHCSSLEMKMAKKIEKSVNQDSTDYETCAVIWFGVNVKLLPLLPLTDSGRFGKDGFANLWTFKND